MGGAKAGRQWYKPSNPNIINWSSAKPNGNRTTARTAVVLKTIWDSHAKIPLSWCSVSYLFYILQKRRMENPSIFLFVITLNLFNLCSIKFLVENTYNHKNHYNNFTNRYVGCLCILGLVWCNSTCNSCIYISQNVIKTNLTYYHLIFQLHRKCCIHNTMNIHRRRKASPGTAQVKGTLSPMFGGRKKKMENSWSSLRTRQQESGKPFIET